MKNTKIKALALVAFAWTLLATGAFAQQAKNVSGKVCGIVLEGDKVNVTVQTGTLNLPLSPNSNEDIITLQADTITVPLDASVGLYHGIDCTGQQARNLNCDDLCRALHIGSIITVFYKADGTSVEAVSMIANGMAQRNYQNNAAPSASAPVYSSRHHSSHHNYNCW